MSDLDGLLYQLAVYKQDLLEESILVTIRAEPSTLALVRNYFPESDCRPTSYLPGIELQEAPLPVGEIHFLDQYDRLIRKLKIKVGTGGTQ